MAPGFFLATLLHQATTAPAALLAPFLTSRPGHPPPCGSAFRHCDQRPTSTSQQDSSRGSSAGCAPLHLRWWQGKVEEGAQLTQPGRRGVQRKDKPFLQLDPMSSVPWPLVNQAMDKTRSCLLPKPHLQAHRTLGAPDPSTACAAYLCAHEE